MNRPVRFPVTLPITLLSLAVSGALDIRPANADLVAHFPLDDDASDATGNGNDGFVVGDVEFGKPGANANTGFAADFVGNSHIDVLFSEDLNPGEQEPDGSGSFTWTVWTNAASLSGYNSPITAREENGDSVNGPILYNTPGEVWSFWGGNNGPSGAWNPMDDSVPGVLDEWVHIAVTYDSETLEKILYIDAEPVVSSIQGISANFVNDTHIGSGQDDGNNYFWDGLLDDVGIWDEVLGEEQIADVMANGIAADPSDPGLAVPPRSEFRYEGTDATFSIPVANRGTNNTLTITEADPGDTTWITNIVLPGPIEPGGSAAILFDFDPAAGNGVLEGTLAISSNDASEPTKSIAVVVTVHDPHLSAPSSVEFGTFPSGAGPQVTSVTLENGGFSRAATITGITFEGADADNFSAGDVGDIAAGAMVDVDLTFTPGAREGTYSATMLIDSNDPVTPQVSVAVNAGIEVTDPLVAWWPLDVDPSDASGNGHDGFDGGFVEYEQPGANANTGLSAGFFDDHIDVPFDPELNPGIEAPDGSGSFTWTVWVNSEDTTGHNSPITSRADLGTSVNGPIIYNTPGNVWSFWGGNNGPSGQWNPLDATIGTEVDEWQHIAVTYDAASTTKTLFVDGEVAATHEVGISANIERDLHIGSGQDDGNNFFWFGRLDDIGIFRVALSQSDIQKTMNEGVQIWADGVAPPTPFEIIDVNYTREPLSVAFTWNSRPGAVYLIERTNDLDGEWLELDDGFMSQGETTTFTDNTIPDGTVMIYYRVGEGEG